MTDISIEKYAGKMNRAGYDAFIQGMRHARTERNRYVDIPHFLFNAVSNQNADISVTLNGLGLDRGRVLKDIDQAMAALDKNVTETPGISETLADALNHAWTYATLLWPGSPAGRWTTCAPYPRCPTGFTSLEVTVLRSMCHSSLIRASDGCSINAQRRPPNSSPRFPEHSSKPSPEASPFTSGNASRRPGRISFGTSSWGRAGTQECSADTAKKSSS